jgi:transposase
MAGRQLAALALSENEHAELRSLAARRNTAQALALRARIVLACAEGVPNKQVAARLQVDRATVGKWRRRLVEHRLDGLRDEPRSGAPRTIEDARIVRTLESVPPDATHWHVAGLRPVGFHGTAYYSTVTLFARFRG